MRNRILMAVSLAALMSSPAYSHEAMARIMAHQPGVNCTSDGMQENVTMSVNFNIKTKSFADARGQFEDKMQQVTNFAKQQNIGKFEMQSMSYNVNAQVTYENGQPEPGYQLNGSASYMLDSSDAAFKLGDFLTQQKFQVNVSVNKYKNGNCNPAQE